MKVAVKKHVMMSDSVSVEFSQQLTQIQRKLYSYILSLVPNRAEAEDILQESNFVLCRKAKEYDKDRNFQAWAFRIARYQVMAFLKTRKRSKLIFSEGIVELLAEELEDNSRFEKMRKALSFCLDELSERSRAVARLRFERNCTLLEIAEKLGRPMGTISATLYRVRVALAQCVRKKVAEEEAAELA